MLREHEASWTPKQYNESNTTFENVNPYSDALLRTCSTIRKRSSRKTESTDITSMNKLYFFGNPERLFELDDLLRASADILGRGTFGPTYKAVLDVGIVVTVKRLKNMTITEREFKEKIDILGSMDHKNVALLRAYYCSRNEKLILNDFKDNGSLSALLHGNRGAVRTPLIWKLRLWIAFGAVCGIQYLHSRGPDVSHGNIKSSNILITKDYDVLVSDFGLVQLDAYTSPLNRLSGYCAPEVTDIRYVSQKADVYSFGVLLLELLTGKPPKNATLNEEGMDLLNWVQSVVREEWMTEVLDIEFLRYENNKEGMIQLLQLAIECASQDPDRRPTITEVAQHIEDLCQLEMKTLGS